MSGKYQNGKIYRIVSADYSKCYVGSTCEGLSQRMARQRYMYNQHTNRGKESYRSANKLFEEFGVDNCKIELIEEYPCNNLMELLKKEGEHIQKYNCVNKVIAGRTDKEYREQNVEKEKLRHQIYYQENKDKRKTYTEANKDNMAEYHKEYRKKNAEQIKAQRKEYREKNKEAIKEQYKRYYEKKKKKQEEPEIEPPLEQLD